MKERAYAKINLSLNVLGKRDDGFHELEMVMLPIMFYDFLEMDIAEETTLSVNRNYIPVNEKNTIIRTIQMMKERFHLEHEYVCNLTKHIPTQAGLGGGSADAAAAIRLINRLEQLHLSEREMAALGIEIGSDVPFCVVNRPAYVTGRGDELFPFTTMLSFYVLIVKQVF